MVWHHQMKRSQYELHTLIFRIFHSKNLLTMLIIISKQFQLFKCLCDFFVASWNKISFYALLHIYVNFKMRPIFCFFSFDIYAICPSKFCHSFENFANHNNKQYFIYLYVSHLVTNIIEINVTIKLSQRNEKEKKNSERTRRKQTEARTK